jgi:hypothetical protein
MDLREIGCEDGRWMELGQDRVQWLGLIEMVKQVLVPVTEFLYVSPKNDGEGGCSAQRHVCAGCDAVCSPNGDRLVCSAVRP